VAAAIAALLVLGAPLAGAAPLNGPVTYHAPFAGKATSARSLSYLGCGTTAQITKLPKFSVTTGVELLGEKTTAKPCASPLGYNTATTTGNGGMWTKPFTGVSGLYHVVVHWTVRWTSNVSAKLGPHQANGQASANAYVAAVLYLVDETNGTYLYPANSWVSTSYTANGSFVRTQSASVTMYLNQSVVSSHTYAIATWIFASTASYAAATGGDTASASLSLTNSGGSTTLTSIVRS
jgi:hypothetical protein